MVSSSFEGVRVRSSSTQFDRVRISQLVQCDDHFAPRLFVLILKASDEPPRISTYQLTAAGAIRFQFHSEMSKINLLLSGFSFENLDEP